jgi:cytochrome c-type biogenesis protein CcmH/NrfG
MKHFTQRNYSEAIEIWKKILEIDPDNESVSKNIEDARQRLEKTGSLEGE